jgi:hypothetical protein
MAPCPRDRSFSQRLSVLTLGETAGTFPGWRVQVYGWGAGCLVVSLLLSIGLTILVNVLIRLF